MPLESVYLNGGLIGTTQTYSTVETSNTTVNATPSFVGASTLSGSGSMALPTGLQQDDIVFVFMADDNNNGGSAPSGWTTLIAENFTNSVWNSVWYKVMGATPDSTVTVPATSAWVAVAFRGVDTSTIFDVPYEGPVTGSSSTVDYPQITTVTDDSMLIAFGGLDDDNSAGVIGAPFSWTLAAAEDNDGTCMVAYKLKTTAGIEPSEFFDATSDAHIGYTIALRRGTTTSSTETTVYNSGIWNLQAVLESLTT